ncbi:hypothetical protein EZV62_010662 [Acer yangbiense]|uniref:Reverse transcriptase Ty1/copia-type domain-containing protein n=1 Tax=Acer yangbiense TaxID=1000413 RepID=A0A5C7I3T9_9ROSI|nr:hypothetical protein EZV62_010662 [Acer yangbiense]
MDASKSLCQNLDEFKKITIELANAGVDEKLSDENVAIILLNSLPDSFKDVKAAIKYDRTSLSLEECILALKSKDLELKMEKKDSGENLFVRGRQLVRNENNNSNNNSYDGQHGSETPNNYRFVIVNNLESALIYIDINMLGSEIVLAVSSVRSCGNRTVKCVGLE